jgi:hypothetical protein
LLTNDEEKEPIDDLNDIIEKSGVKINSIEPIEKYIKFELRI